MKEFLFLILLLRNPLFGLNVEERLKHVSWLEKICMRSFFSQAIKTDQLAHTIFFINKPVCFTTVTLKDRHRTFRDILCAMGWKAFRKNEYLFPHSNFIISEKIYEDKFLKTIDIYIVNRCAITNCIHAHEVLFKKTLGDDFTLRKFISKLERGVSLLSLINNDEVLLGILLGFGEESSKAYQEAQGRCIVPWSESYCGVEVKRPRECDISSVSFMGNPRSNEVKLLLSSYEKELDEIWKIYQQSQDGLVTTLEKLCD